MKKKPKWIPLSVRTLDRITAKIATGGNFSLYIFRLTPFTRGYTSVIAGLLRIKPEVYLPVVLITAFTWAAVYIIIGKLIGPSWDLFSENINNFKYYMILTLAIISGMVFLVFFIRKKGKNKRNISMNIS